MTHTPSPDPARYLIACDNNGHEWLLFDRKDALACGSFKDITRAKDHLDKGGK